MHRICLICAILITTIMLPACHTIFDYRPPDVTHSTDKIVDTVSASVTATEYAQAYDEWAQNLAITPQFFEVPIIGTAIATVAELAYSHPHAAPATTLALAGGGLYALNNYYAARDRMSIYLAGAQAMRCVAMVANGLAPAKTATAFAALSGTSIAATSFRGLQAKALQVKVKDPLVISILADAATTEESAPSLLRDAIDQINTKVVTDALSKSVSRNPTQIVSDLKTAIKADLAKPQQVTAALIKLSASTAGEVSTFVASPATQATLTLDSDLKACIAKAGT